MFLKSLFSIPIFPVAIGRLFQNKTLLITHIQNIILINLTICQSKEYNVFFYLKSLLRVNVDKVGLGYCKF